MADFYPCHGSGEQAPSIRNAERKADEGLIAIPTMKNMAAFYYSLVTSTVKTKLSWLSRKPGQLCKKDTKTVEWDGDRRVTESLYGERAAWLPYAGKGPT